MVTFVWPSPATLSCLRWGHLPRLDLVDFEQSDVVFTWNGTTSGVCLPNGDWIDPHRKGLTLCDATSAAFS